MLIQRAKRVAGPVAVLIEVEDGASRADLDNMQKATIDLLVRQNMIDGDEPRTLRSTAMFWSDNVVGMQVTIVPA